MPPVAESRHRWRPSPFLIASAGLHGAALATLVGSPRAWDLALMALVGNHVVISGAAMLPRCAWLGPNLSRIPAGRAGAELVALTFDDGPDPELTPAVLDQLSRAGARATFFCLGQRAEAHPHLVAAIREQGHGVENHSYSHPHTFAFRGPRAMLREILRAQDAIERSGGGRPAFFRAPAGIQNPWLAPVLAVAGLSLVSWTRRGFDTVSESGISVASRLTRGLGPGDIMLLHDGSAGRQVRNSHVVLEALPRVLEQLRRRGLRSEPLHVILQAHERRPPDC